MNKRTRSFFCAVVAMATLGAVGNVQAALIFLGNDPNENIDPSAGAFGQFFVPEGTIVELAPTGAGPTVWAKITTGGGVGGPNGTTLTSFGKALGADDLDNPTDNDTKVDVDEWAQFEFYLDAAATAPATLLIDLAFKDFTGNGDGDTGLATTFDADGSTMLDGIHRFNDDDGSSSGNGVTYQKTGGPLTDYVTFSQPAHIYRIQNDSTSGNGWKIAYFDPGDYRVVPEPAGLALLGLGMLVTCAMRRRMI